MTNFIIYLFTIFIWGTTWLAIKLQLAEVAPEISILYRMLIATIFFIVYCMIKKTQLRFSIKEHASLFLLGLLMFSIHYIFLYNASFYLVSGLVSIIFSWVSIFNIVNSYFFFKKKPERQVVWGACLGLLGIFVFFLQEIRNFSFQSQALRGIAFSLLGALLFSFGNMASKKNQMKGMDIVPSMAMAMIYGTFILAIYALVSPSPFILPKSTLYWSSVLYLSIFGTIVAFLCYLNLIRRMGPERAGYATVIFPVVALLISLFFENYKLQISDLIGITLIIIGNLIVLFKKWAFFRIYNQ